MTLKEYVRTVYNIEDQVKAVNEDPVKLVMERDDLPADDAKYIDGVLQKIVYLSDEEFISVVDLLGYTKEEIDAQPNSDLANVWTVYMEKVELTDMGIEAIMSSCQELAKVHKNKEGLIRKLGE